MGGGTGTFTVKRANKSTSINQKVITRKLSCTAQRRSGLGESGELLEEAAGTGKRLEGIRFRAGASGETVIECREALARCGAGQLVFPFGSRSAWRKRAYQVV